VTLRGDFSFDAISPDGRWAYLIHYLSPRNPTDYEVRAFDVEKQRLVPGPIVDPDEPGERMNGIPLSRATSPDGRWAYTLYTGKETFVHALDTTNRTAVCVDLPRFATRRILAAATGLSLDGDRQLVVTADGRPIALIDTRTFQVNAPPTPAGNGDDGGSPFVWLLALALFSAAIVGLGLRHVRSGSRRARPGVAAGAPD
jgi:hypothetical protein